MSLPLLLPLLLPFLAGPVCRVLVVGLPPRRAVRLLVCSAVGLATGRIATLALLAAHCHPGLRAVRELLRYALERTADECAAQTVGDRRLTARAIGRAALAARTSPARCRPGFALAATTGPVPLRVAALLVHPARTRVPGAPPRLAALVLLACLAVSTGASFQAVDDLHAGIEIAQGETGEE